MAKYPRIMASRFAPHIHEALELTAKNLNTDRSEILREAFGWWIATSNHRLSEAAYTGRDRGNGIRVRFSKDHASLLKAIAFENEASTGRVLEAAFVAWFDARGGKLLYDASIAAPGKRKPSPPRPKPTPAKRNEGIEILRQQLQHFQSTGNALRVATIRRELLAMGVAA